MRGKRSPWKAAGAFALIMIAGCGTGRQAPSSVVATASNPIATTTAPTTRDKYESARYCQQLESGAWVTNRLHSTTPCVPDPSHATGDEEVDRSHVIPRCFTCKLSDWTRAEQNKARQASAPSGYASSSVTASQSEWSGARRAGVIATCTSSWGGTQTLCDCVVNHVAQQIPAPQASSLSPDDARLEAAVGDCDDAGHKSGSSLGLGVTHR
jgi:hypothetical protein